MSSPSSNPKGKDTKASLSEKLTSIPASTDVYVLDASTGEYVLNVPERISKLLEVLAEDLYSAQHANVQKAISMYESGELPLPGHPLVWFENGEVIDGEPQEEDFKKGVVFWSEGLWYQFSQGAAATLPADDTGVKLSE